MITKTDIEKFYRDVASLRLKFPVKEIQKATKYGKGNISEILSKKKEPSEAFMKKFYAQFYKNSTVEKQNIAGDPILSYSAAESTDPITVLAESNRLIAESNRALAESNKALAKGNAELAESNKSLAKSNADIMRKASTDNGPQESSLTVQTILPGLLGLLNELGQGKLWDSADQGETILSKRLFGHLKKGKVAGTHDGSHKSRK